MLGFLLSALKIIFLLGFLILIHECGHFLFARLCKVRVNEFAIGFGPTIWKKQGKQTKYALRLIPLGGFVSMEGEEERSDTEGSFSKAPIWKRIIIVIAGGLVNIIFGLIVYFILATTGSTYISNNVDYIVDEYAQSSQIQKDDKIIKINDKTIRLKSDYDSVLDNCNGEAIKVKIQRNGSIIEKDIVPFGKEIKTTGIYLSATGSTKIVAITPDSVAQKAGLQENDLITKINDVDINNDYTNVINSINSFDELEFTVVRNNEEVKIKLVPEKITKYYLGIVFKASDDSLIDRIYYGFWDTTSFGTSIIDNLRTIFSGKVQANQLMGPVGISEVVAKTNGIREFIYMLALISLSLGVTNLLPIPALDGGKLVILIIEGIRRKPLKQELEIGIQMVGFFALIALSIYVAYNDILRIF